MPNNSSLTHTLANKFPDKGKFLKEINLSIFTQDQEKALIKLFKFLEKDNRYLFRLQGYAGTGKSFTSSYFLYLLRYLTDYHVAVASPTNKALKNIKNMFQKLECKLDYFTVAQLLKKAPVFDKSTGEEEFLTVAEPLEIANYNVILIDEYSMIGIADFEELYALAQHYNIKIIFVGDSGQLPPILSSQDKKSALCPDYLRYSSNDFGNQEKCFSIVAASGFIRDAVVLKDIVRNSGKLREVSLEIRKNPRYADRRYHFVDSDDGTIQVVNGQNFLEIFAKDVDSDAFKADSNYVRAVTYTNKRAEDINDYVRRYVFGAQEASECLYRDGELLIARTPCIRSKIELGRFYGGDKQDLSHRRKNTIIINNSEELFVENYNNEDLFNTVDFDDWEYGYRLVTVYDSLRQRHKVRILDTKSKKHYKKHLKQLSEEKNWKMFFKIRDFFDDVVHAYAITTHKSQGSTFKKVYVDYTDLKRCYEKQKILYTALTRASEKAIIFAGN